MKVILGLLVALMVGAPAFAHDFAVGNLTLKHPMIAETPPVAPVAGGYVTIVNAGQQPDRLLGIESDAAAKVELHKSTITDGIARMRPMTEGLTIPPGATVVLGENGTHAMFVQPIKRLKAGDTVNAVLVFEQAGRVDVVFNVEKKSAGEMSGGQMNGQ